MEDFRLELNMEDSIIDFIYYLSIEAMVPLQALHAYGISVDNVYPGKYDGIVIPGGRAPEYLVMDKSVQELVKSFSNFGKPIANVCHNQLIL
ncbi:hypothetical protein AgCh_020596 [Apium graveolens]